MIGKEIISERYVTISQVKDLVTNKKRSSEEISYELGCALDYLEKFTKLNAEDSKELVSKLINLGLDEKTSVKIADVLPEDLDDLKIIFYKSEIPKNAKEILDVVSQYR
ncbi:MAG TPA: DNA-directed RNA polymerase subunit F [Methanothermococcus okinawensis]|uniref:DNA-directed RNA polymerase subunit Rpo4 n=1 Tax=Methanothermococcus okinawensis TaxID=155863 RepID=A0A833DPT4_9EURY|nr:DNA-directed RNA polymerase subunit F [Methanothermococcus okinawensis]